LHEESSDTRTVGVVFTPTFAESLAVTLDYFKITLDGAIAQLGGGAQSTLNLCYLQAVKDPDSEFCRAVHRNPGSGVIQVPYTLDVLQANIGSLVTSGYDLNGRYGFDVGFGMEGKSRFDIGTAWTLTKEFTVTPMQATPLNKNRCVGAYGQVCGEPIPELKGATRFTWSTGPLSVSLRHRFIDSVTTDRYVLAVRNARALEDEAARAAALAQAQVNYGTYSNPKLPSKNYFDLSATFDIGDKAEVYAGINNVLDTDPPIVAGFGGYGNTFPATYDYAGMTMFLGVNIKTF